MWPAAIFLDERDASGLPPFIEETARRATNRLLAADLPCVLGHADWETQNLRRHGRTIWAVHDWDSLAWLPEAAIAGAASGTFASAEIPTLAPLTSSEAFLEAYQHERRRQFNTNGLVDARTRVIAVLEELPMPEGQVILVCIEGPGGPGSRRLPTRSPRLSRRA